MKRFKLFILSLSLLVLISGCGKYNNYIEDFEFTSVYFGTQKPLRTVVARDPFQIKIGVALGGVRENTTDRWVKFRLDPGLLQTVDGANIFTLLPKAYYSIVLPNEDSTFTISSGKIIGDLVLKINKDAFTADPLAVNKTYALPIRIYETSADSILMGNDVTPAKDYTIIVIKYISPESGTYYVKGSETDKATNIATAYSFSDLIKNKTRDLTTLSISGLDMGGIGARTASALYKMIISLKTDGGITLSTATGGVAITDLGSSYDASKKTFTLKYSYVDAAKTYVVDEQIIQRQDPELDLRFEEW
jgi:hypothetical protein